MIPVTPGATYNVIIGIGLHQDDLTGSVEVGKFADLIVLDRDPLIRLRFAEGLRDASSKIIPKTGTGMPIPKKPNQLHERTTEMPEQHCAVPPCRFVFILFLVFAVQCFSQKPPTPQIQSSRRGVLLETLSWDEAEHELMSDRVVVIALGAESKEHGKHLQLNNDWVMAEYFKKRVLAAAPVVIAPTINYSYYPAFLEYPGSTSLESNTARDMVVEICHTLASHGPRRFYILNTGISTIKPLSEAAKMLSSDGITLRYFDFQEIDGVVKKVQRETEGTHADEIETSMMLYIAPNTVRMSKAEKDLHPDRPGPLTRDPNAPTGTYSPTGAWGDPTLATKEKGRIVVEATVKAILGDIQNLQGQELLSR